MDFLAQNSSNEIHFLVYLNFARFETYKNKEMVFENQEQQKLQDKRNNLIFMIFYRFISIVTK